MRELERIKEQIQHYEIKINEYKQGNADPNIRGIRAIMGVYPERETEKYMTRIKTPAGLINIKQLRLVSEVADKYSYGKIHFTTRQDIQFHGVELDNTTKIMREVLEVGINSLGAGGNSARNVACSPLSGVAEDEIFDVTPYALAASEHLLKDPSTLKLPRKYKVSFSNSKEDTAYATISDLGFIAKVNDGKKGFEVYGAGGLGGSPAIALKLEDLIEDKDVLYYVEAMKELFFNEGDRENRNKARIRYIVARVGEEKFRELFKYYLDKVKKELNLSVDIKSEVKEYSNEDSKPSTSSLLVSKQKQQGYYAINVHTRNGYMYTKDLNEILNYIESLDYKVSIRLTNSQGFYIRDIKGKDVDGLLEIVKKFTKELPIDNIVSCVGMSVCGTGLCNSPGLSTAIAEKFATVSEEIKSLMPQIRISGCPNSCGQHQVAELGFTGRSIRGKEGMIPAYRVFIGGAVKLNETKFGEVKGDIAAKKIPEFLCRLAILMKENGYTSFNKFIQSNKDKVEALIKEFEVIDEEPDLYYDYGSNIKFLSKK